MTKNSRASFVLAVCLLLIGGFYRLIGLQEIPPGLHGQEVIDLRLAENVRQGTVQVFFDIGGEGREILYPALLSAYTGIMGSGPVIYHALSLWVGMIVVALTFAIARRLYGDLAGIASMGVMALSWWPVLLSRTTGREVLLPLLIALVLLALVLALPAYLRRRSASFQTTWFAVLGAAVALGVYLHPAGVLVAIAALVIVVGYNLRGIPRPSDAVRRAIGFTLLVMGILILPYILTTINSPALNGLTRIFNGFTVEPTPLPERLYRAILGLGLSGEGNPAYNLPLRPLFDPVTAVITLIGLVVSLMSGPRLRYSILSTFVVFIVPLGLFAPNSPSWIAFSAPVLILALCYGLGISFISQRLPDRRLAYALVAGVLAFNTVWLGLDLLGGWASAPETRAVYGARVAELAHHVDKTATRIPTYICTGDIRSVTAQPSINAARLLGLMLHRPEHVRGLVNCASGLVFTQGGEQMQVIMPDTTMLDYTSDVVLDWLDWAEVISTTNDIYTLNVVAQLADRIGLFTTSAPVRLSPEADPSGEIRLPPIQLEDNLTFLGYEILPAQVPAGGTIEVATYWRVDGPLPADLTLFAHVYDDLAAEPIGNQDAISAVPSQLTERDILLQIHTITLPDKLLPRSYTLAIGAYRQTSGERLRVLQGEALTPRGSRLILYPIEVTTTP
jgi:hypothetical protein